MTPRTQLERACARLPVDADSLADMMNPDNPASPLDCAAMLARIRDHLSHIELAIPSGAITSADHGFPTAKWHKRGPTP